MAPVPKPIHPRWTGGTVVVAAPGPSLTPEVARWCLGVRKIAVQDAWRLLPWAEVLYGCDARWWDLHEGCPGFGGEKWSSHHAPGNDKLRAAEKYGLQLVAGAQGEGFSRDPERIHYGANSGFQAINLAILFGARRIVLVGFDMRAVEGRRHFFGDHPRPLVNLPDYRHFVPAFARAAELLPPEIEIVNATHESALTCFPKVSLAEALA